MRHALLFLLLAVGNIIPLAAASPPEWQLLAGEVAAGRHRGIDGFVLIHKGSTLVDIAPKAYARKPPDIRSATKSVTALLMGIALDRGLLPDIHQPVIELLPEYAPWLGDDPRKAAMTLEDLMTMRSGLACDDWDENSPGHEDRMYRHRDWLQFWASQPMQTSPGEQFSYCTGNVIALGRILKHATGQSVAEFARQSLFEPLGISGARWAEWNRGADIDSGGHLRIRPHDLAVIGSLVLAGGRYSGQQLVSTSWIERMTQPRTAVPGQNQRYGLLWWIDAMHGPRLGDGRVWLARGNGGNFIVLLPDQEIVAVFTGTRFNKPQAQEPLVWLRDRVLPALLSRSPDTGLNPTD